MKQYALSMGFRVAAFPLGVWAISSGWTIIGWIVLVFAMIIPSIAVAFANAVDLRSEPSHVDKVEHPALGEHAEDPENPEDSEPGDFAAPDIVVESEPPSVGGLAIERQPQATDPGRSA